jgi:phage N-6-adenine-methyltransferase
MNTAFEKTANTTDEWYTPKEIIDALGCFDLDPCAPTARLWDTAHHHLTRENDGLAHDWFGRVWLNPPYSRPLIERFMEKMARHNNGIALLFNRADSKMFQEQVFDEATAILFMRGRVQFYRPDGTRTGTPGCGSVLVAYGYDNARLLKHSGISGKYIELR